MQIAIRSQNSHADYNNLLACDYLVQTEAKLAISDSVLREYDSNYKGLIYEHALDGVLHDNFIHVAYASEHRYRPVTPNLLVNTRECLLAGLFLGMLLTFLLDQFDKKVRTADALTHLLDWPVVGTIWHTR